MRYINIISHFIIDRLWENDDHGLGGHRDERDRNLEAFFLSVYYVSLLFGLRVYVYVFIVSIYVSITLLRLIM